MIELVKTDNGNYTHPDDPGESYYDGSPKRLSVTDEECEILTRIATKRNVLEIGTGLGLSTRALGLSAGWVVSVDPDPWVHKNVWSDLLPLGLCVRADMPRYGKRFDLVFIDGNHNYDAVESDLKAVCKALRSFAPVVLHDYEKEVKHAAEDAGFVLVKDFNTKCRMVVGVLP